MIGPPAERDVGCQIAPHDAPDLQDGGAVGRDRDQSGCGAGQAVETRFLTYEEFEVLEAVVVDDSDTVLTQFRLD